MRRQVRRFKWTIFLLLLFILTAEQESHAEWSLVPGLTGNSQSGQDASSSLLYMPDSTFVLVTLSLGEPISSLHFQRFSQSGALVSQGSSLFASLDLEPPLHATVVDTSLFAIGINATVTPPTGTGRDILIRTFNTSFEQVGSQLVSHQGADSLTGMIGLDATHVAFCGEESAPAGRALMQTMSVDGLLGWGWQDTNGSHDSSIGLDLVALPLGRHALLVRESSSLGVYARILEFGADGSVESMFIDHDTPFMFHKGSMITGLDGERVYYCGFDPLDQGWGYMLGMVEFESGIGWQEYDDFQIGDISLFWPYSPFDPESIYDVLVVGRLEASIQCLIPTPSEPPVEWVDISYSGQMAIEAPSGGVVLLGENVERIGRNTDLFYSYPLESEALGGARISDSTIVVLQAEETTPGRYTHTLQWFTEHFENEPPGPPVPYYPLDGVVISQEDLEWTQMSWDRPIDPDPESDVSADLILQVQRFARPDTLFTLRNLENDTYPVENLGGISGVPIEQVRGAMWKVRCVSQGDTVEMSEPWSFTIQAADVAESAQPTAFQVELYPNPFNASTRVHLTLPEPIALRVSLVNLLGQEVFEIPFQRYTAGPHTIPLEPGLSSGLYLLRIQDNSGHLLAARRAILIQ